MSILHDLITAVLGIALITGWLSTPDDPVSRLEAWRRVSPDRTWSLRRAQDMRWRCFIQTGVWAEEPTYRALGDCHTGPDDGTTMPVFQDGRTELGIGRTPESAVTAALETWP